MRSRHLCVDRGITPHLYSVARTGVLRAHRSASRGPSNARHFPGGVGGYCAGCSGPILSLQCTTNWSTRMPWACLGKSCTALVRPATAWGDALCQCAHESRHRTLFQLHIPQHECGSNRGETPAPQPPSHSYTTALDKQHLGRVVLFCLSPL